MQVTMPVCGVAVEWGRDVLTLGPNLFEFHFHYDDREEGGQRLSALMSRLGELGFTCRGVPVSGICAYKFERLPLAICANLPMVEFIGSGADWLEHIVTALEAIRDTNASRLVHDQYYDPCSV